VTPRWSNLTSDDVVRKLVSRGFKKTKQKGSHAYYYREDGAFAFVPLHKGRNLSRAVIRSIMRTSGLTKRDLEN